MKPERKMGKNAVKKERKEEKTIRNITMND
jgi:hypothetical protein